MVSVCIYTLLAKNTKSIKSLKIDIHDVKARSLCYTIERKVGLETHCLHTNTHMNIKC